MFSLTKVTNHLHTFEQDVLKRGVILLKQQSFPNKQLVFKWNESDFSYTVSDQCRGGRADKRIIIDTKFHSIWPSKCSANLTSRNGTIYRLINEGHSWSQCCLDWKCKNQSTQQKVWFNSHRSHKKLSFNNDDKCRFRAGRNPPVPNSEKSQPKQNLNSK